MNYNKIYKKYKNVWGKFSNNLLQVFWRKIKPGSSFLDLGCGQGRDSLFMARKGFKVTSVDSSNEAIHGLNLIAKKNNLNIQTICKNIEKFEVEDNKYSIINIFDTLHFLEKKDALKLIRQVKENIKDGGLLIISDFTTKDVLFKKGKNKTKAFFRPKELLKLFFDFNVLLYKEFSIIDSGHPGLKQPHRHQIVELVVQKKQP